MFPKLDLIISVFAFAAVAIAGPTRQSGLQRFDDTLSQDPLISFNLHQEYGLDLDDDDQNDQQTAFHVSLPPPSRVSPTFALKARPTTVYRPRSTDAFQHARLRSLHHAESERVDWEEVEMSGPDITDQYTLSQLARMTGNAYALPMGKGWYDMDPAWNTVCREFYYASFASQRSADRPAPIML